MPTSCAPFDERMRNACHLASLKNHAEVTDADLAEWVSRESGSVVIAETIEAWRSGRIMPSLDQRAALARALGFVDDFGEYLTSDEEATILPIHAQLGTVLAMAANRTGLVALRARTKPLDVKATEALRRLA